MPQFPLINLAIRHELIQVLALLLPEAQQLREKIALLLIDLDHFKNINAALGIKTADLLLAEVANRLYDLLPDCYKICHFGGGTFIILLRDLETGTEYVANIAARILRAIHQNYQIDGHNIVISASIGIAMFPDHTADPENLLRYADLARYNAKKCGRNTYCFYNTELNNQVLARTLMYAELRDALKNAEFSLYYQPKICIKTKQVIGAEALIRWEHPKKGKIPPDIFIPIAEDSGLIIPLGNWILRTACNDLKKLTTAGFNNFNMAINLSPYQFNDGDVASDIAEIIWETNVDAAAIELELTESVVMGNPEKSKLMLSVLKAMGVKLAIDDFGTGYSSLGQLNNFIVDTLKIDRSFIQKILVDPETATIVHSIIKMAHQLDLKIVAEGVETKQQVTALAKIDCDYIQGYFYSQPLPFDQLLEFLKQHNS